MYYLKGFSCKSSESTMFFCRNLVKQIVVFIKKKLCLKEVLSLKSCQKNGNFHINWVKALDFSWTLGFLFNSVNHYNLYKVSKNKVFLWKSCNVTKGFHVNPVKALCVLQRLCQTKRCFFFKKNLHEEEVLSLKTCHNNRDFHVNWVKVLGFFKQ